MKKLIIALAIMAMAAVHAAEFQFPGWGCKDVALLQQQLELAPTEGWKMTISIVLACAQNPPADFAAACTVIDNAITALKPEATDAEKLWSKKQYANTTGQWLVDAWQYCKANPSNYDVYYLLARTPAQLGETPDSYYEAVYQTLVVGINNPAHAGKLIKHFCNYLPKSNIPRPERFAKLQMLNDIYTGKLIEDKAAWGEVIAQIRTVMELYK
ncbi:MAG: hypothetical protein WCQ61_07450 [Proteiniphilum sp.]